MGRMRWLVTLAALPAAASISLAQLVPLPPPPRRIPVQIDSLVPLDEGRPPGLYASSPPPSRFGAFTSASFSPYHGLWVRKRHRPYAFWAGSTRIIIAQPIVIVTENPAGYDDGSRFDTFVPRRPPAEDGGNPANQPPAAPQRPPPEPLPAPTKQAEPLPAPAKQVAPPPEKPRAEPIVPAPVPSPPAGMAADREPVPIQLGKRAFAAQEYGRAERYFRQATVDAPDARAHFLLAQALFARTRYAEAVAEIDAGLRLRADWPSSSFHPRTLYAADAPDFAEQLQHLDDLVAHNPRDPILLFLYAYELWFDGRGVEARLWFERALADGADRTAVERFLTSEPPPP